MAAAIRLGRSKRGVALQTTYRRAFLRALIPAILVHAILLVWLVAPRSEASWESAGGEFDVVDIPPETKIPPPPEEIARPAVPVVGTVEVAPTVTIAETDLVENQEVVEISAEPSAPPAPVAAPEPVGQTFSFTPYTVKPKCRAGCTPEEILEHVPPLFRNAGFSCELTMGIRIDTAGRVTATDVIRPSGKSACDAAVAEWARTTSWTVAYNRDQPVSVWIAQPVQLTAGP